MKPIVLMHSCSVWPTSIDFHVFRCYLEGYSVEETVERLMTETSASPTHTDVADNAAPLPGTDKRGVGVPCATPPPTAPALSPAKAALSPLAQAEPRLQREDPRALGSASEADTILLPAWSADGRRGEAEAAVRETPSTPTSAVDPRSSTAPTTTTTTEVGVSPPKHASDKLKPTHRKGTAKQDRALPNPTSVRHGTSHRDREVEVEGSRGTGSTGALASAARRRTRKPKSFFLNEDYLDFQRRLMQVEGGPQSYAAALKSQLLFEEVAEQYQLFDVLTADAYVGRPYSFLTSTYLPFPVEERLRLVRAYYPTDEVVRRYFFGDKMTKLSSIWSDPSTAAGALRDGGAGSGAGGAGSREGPAWQRLFGALLAPLRDRTVDRDSLSILNDAALLASGAAPGTSPTMHGGYGSVTAGGGVSGDHGAGAGLPLPGRTEEDQARLDWLTLSHLPAVSLKRQWENIKNVSTSLSAMYRGKGGLFLPRELPLRKAVEQCYALEGELASSYATLTFGVEHRLVSKLFKRFHSFAEYEAVCTILGSVWCDSSMLLLDEAFIEGCKRICRLLDETRVVAELHALVFGEAMRPRWQVQLDEVQRAITTSSASPVTASTGGGGSSSAAGLGTLSPVPAPLGTSTGLPPPAAAYACPQAVANAGSPVAALPSAAGASAPDLSGAASSASAALAGLHGSPLSATLGGGSSAASPSATNGAATSAPVSANKLFSRRLLIEFPGMMKNLARIASQIGANENVSEALDLYFHRIYVYLETLSSRAAPGLVSVVLQQQQQHQQQQQQQQQQQHCAKSPSTGALAATTGTGGVTEEAIRAAALAASNASNSPATTTTAASPPTSRSLRRAVSSVLAVPASPSSPLAAPFSESARIGAATMSATGSHAAAPTTSMAMVSGAFMALPTSVVNSSVAHPAAAMRPSLCAPPAGLSRVTSSVSVGESAGLGTSATAGTEASTTAADADDVPLPLTTRPGLSSAMPPSAMEAVVLRALDKRLLRELCQLLNALPKAWRQLSALTAEDHEACDAPLNRLVMAFKAISQILMATDDFN